MPLKGTAPIIPVIQQQNATADQLDDSFVDENDNNIAYTQLKRDYGAGEIRIGSFLDLEEDIYSLGVFSCVKNDIIDQCMLPEESQPPPSSQKSQKTPKGGFSLF